MNQPEYIQILNRVEIFDSGNVLKLRYGGTPDAMYAYPGAVFGISATRASKAITNKDAIIYNPQPK